MEVVDEKFLLKGLLDLGDILNILVGVDEGGLDGHGEGAKTLVIDIMPVFNPDLVGDFVILLFLGRFISGDGISSTDGTEVASDEGDPLLAVGASSLGTQPTKKMVEVDIL